jgi:dinuclear metal center YbgI/SA1388 family protein
MVRAMARVADLIAALKSIAPLEYAEPWDNVGLLIGSERWPADDVLLTIDLTERVLHEAIAGQTQMIVAYHPPIFPQAGPISALTDATAKTRIVLEAAHAGIAVYSPHTALDAAPGGVNDWIAEGLGTGDVRALVSHEHLPFTEQCKIVTFCPPDAVDRLRQGLAAVGAGRIGEYQQCSFEIAGTGTFFGSETSNPSVGRKGELERVGEVRLEMVCPREALGLAVLTLREFHPYEEPPIEIYELLARPQRSVGPGRRVTLDRKVTISTIIERVKKQLGVKRVQVAEAAASPEKYETIGLCAGAGGALLDEAVRQGCELFVTGEMRHHDVIAAQQRDCAVILAGHTNTERGYLPRLRKRLRELLPKIECTISQRDADPLRSA